MSLDDQVFFNLKRTPPEEGARIWVVRLKMSKNSDLTKYFSENKAGRSVEFFDEVSNKVKSGDFLDSEVAMTEDRRDTTSVEKEDEPVVCKIFQEVGSRKAQESDSANFFDVIAETTGGSHSLPREGSIRNSKFTTSPDILHSFKNYEESFSNSSKICESERTKDAWIPPEHTRKLLIEMVTSPPGTYVPKREFLTMPGVILEEDMKDPVYEVVHHYLGPVEASKRKVLNASEVTQDDRGIRDLIQAGCYRAAINLTKSLLTIYGQGAGRAGHPSKHTVHSIQLWFTRLALLVKLRSFLLAQEESEPFGDLDKPDMFFQFYPDLYGGRSGSMVPFGLRLLIAQLPAYVEKHQLALTRLYSILFTIRKMLSNLEKGLFEDGTPCELNSSVKKESIRMWSSRESRVLHAVVNTALAFKDYNLAIEVMGHLISKERDEGQSKALRSALGRILLELGDVSSAERQFAASRSATPACRDLIDSGLLLLSQNHFQEAYHTFEEAYRQNPKSIAALNNMALCLLYLGRLKDSVLLLEEAVQKYPELALHESLLLNLSTLYELQSSFDPQSKLRLLSLVNQHKGDGINAMGASGRVAGFKRSLRPRSQHGNLVAALKVPLRLWTYARDGIFGHRLVGECFFSGVSEQPWADALYF